MKRSQDHSLCQQYQDQPSSLRASCEGEKTGKRPKAEGQSKSRADLVLALLCLFLFISGWWILFSPARQATARLPGLPLIVNVVEYFRIEFS